MNPLLDTILFGCQSAWGAIFMAVATVCGLCTIALVMWAVGRAVSQSRERVRFMERAGARGFDPQERDILWQLSAFVATGPREEILSSVDLFDRCVLAAREAMGREIRRRPVWLSPAALDCIRRRYQEAEARSRHRFASTREIEYNQAVTVRCPDGYTFDAFAFQVTSQGLYLSYLPREGVAERIVPGTRLVVSFWRPKDARYEFETHAIGRADAFARTFIVAHSSLRRIQERGYVRVRWHQPVVVTPLTREDGTEVSGEAMEVQLHDLSIGGASFRCSAPLDEGATVILRLGTGDNGLLSLTGRIVRRSPLNGTSQPMFLTSVRFEDTPRVDENRLARLVAQIQQSMIRRTMARAGAYAGLSRAPAAERISRRPERSFAEVSSARASPVSAHSPLRSSRAVHVPLAPAEEARSLP